jgi:hypothetical protein
MTAAAALAGFVFAGRLGLIVLATPPASWLTEFGPLTGPPGEADATVRRLADRLAGNLSDAALVRGRHAACLDEVEAANAAADYARRIAGLEACIAIVDDGLAADPASGELWLERARLLSASGIFDERLQTALARSYASSPREGWIAASRVVLGLRLEPLLPPDFAGNIERDLGTVLQSRALATPLVDAYLADEALRVTTNAALQSLPDVAAQERFVSWVRSRINSLG